MFLTLVFLILCAFLASSSSGQAYAVLTNITIDDTNSAFWTFVGSYSAVTPSTPCSACFAQPDAGLAYNSTWHDGSGLSGSFVFQGTAVYIYGIDVLNPANVTFAMSNPSIASFHPYSGSGYVYNSLFFSATQLDPSVQHTVTWLMETSSVGGGAALFDYAKVTINQADASSSSASISLSTPSSTSSSSSASTTRSTVAPTKHKSKTGLIVGAVVGVVGGLALLGALFILLRHWQATHASTAPPGGTNGGIEYTIEPFQPPPLLASEHSARSRPFEASDSRSAVSLAAVRPALVSTSTLPSMPVGPSEYSDSPSISAGSMPAWDRGNPSGERARQQEVEERLRNLEELVAQPPAYR